MPHLNSSRSGYRAGEFLRICDRCGFRRYASDTRKEWTGLFVCADTCFEARHPQDFVRGTIDRQTVPDPRPEYTGARIPIDIYSLTIDDTSVDIDQQGDRFLDTNEVTAADL